jgi:glucose-6-phosphate isomerase (EC 5.3.1.9)
MYRDLAQTEEDRAWLSGHALRYDVTRIPPFTLCGEYVKTKGHHHPCNPAGVGYPEVYEVLRGEAHYLLQDRQVHDVVLIYTREGEKVIIPPGYGHVTINASSRTLLMANIVSTQFSSDYSLYEERHGAAYYMMIGKEMVKNPQYPSIPVLRSRRPPLSIDLNLREDIPLYQLIEERADLSFLNHPERFTRFFRESIAD